ATDPVLTTTNSGFLAGDLGTGKITFSATRTSGETVANSPYTITPAASDGTSGLLSNYTVTYISAAFTITKATASERPAANTNTTSNSSATDPVLATTNSGFLAGDLGAGKITFSATRTSGEAVAVSPYTITPAASDGTSGLLNNYTVTYNTANFTITKAT